MNVFIQHFHCVILTFYSQMSLILSHFVDVESYTQYGSQLKEIVVGKSLGE